MIGAVLSLGLLGFLGCAPADEQVADDGGVDTADTANGAADLDTEFVRGDVVINEVMADFDSSGVDAAHSGDWIELLNRGETSVETASLQVVVGDKAGDVPCTGEVIEPGAYLLIAVDHGPEEIACRIGREGLYAGGDVVRLFSAIFNETGELSYLQSDAVAWATPLAGDVSYARTPDGTGDFVVTEAPTPGASND